MTPFTTVKIRAAATVVYDRHVAFDPRLATRRRDTDAGSTLP